MKDKQRHADSAVIDALGGTTVVATLTGCCKTVVSKWRHRGIPARVRVEHYQLIRSAERRVRSAGK